MVEAAARKIVPKDGETQEQAEQAFSVETCLRQSLLSNELSISHMKIGCLPLTMGETIFLQVLLCMLCWPCKCRPFKCHQLRSFRT